jgi:hypothetical protein
MKKLILIFTVLMFTLTVKSQTTIKVYKSVTIDEYDYNYTQAENFILTIDVDLQKVTTFKGRTLTFYYYPNRFYKHDGYYIMDGSAIEFDSQKNLSISIDTKINGNLIIVTLARGDTATAYIGVRI